MQLTGLGIVFFYFKKKKKLGGSLDFCRKLKHAQAYAMKEEPLTQRSK